MAERTLHAAILADGDVPSGASLDAAWPGWADGVDLVIAADGGARHAEPLGLRIDRWVGDGDSIEPAELERLAAAGVAMERAPTDKDESDTELALLAALSAGATTITLLGGLGGLRIDHALANVALLQDPALDGHLVRMFDGHAARVSLLFAADSEPASNIELTGRAGDIVTLLPLGGPASGVTTQGLRYPLAGETLAVGRSRGLSNVRTGSTARITLESGRLLVIETPVTVEP